MRRFIITFIQTLVVFSALTFKTFAAEVIENFNTNYVIKNDGTINVTESIDYNFGDIEKHGIFRNIKRIKTNDAGKRFVLGINVDSVQNEIGELYKYTTYKNGDYLVIKIGDANVQVSGNKTYVIKYNVSGAITYFDTNDEFYWNATGNEWEVPIFKATSDISITGDTSTANIETICFTGPQGSTSQNCTVSMVNNTAKIETTNLGVGEGLTFAVRFPKGIVQVLEPKEDKPNLFAFIFNAIITLVLTLGGLYLYLVLPIILAIKWGRRNSDLRNKAKIVAAWFSPPKTDEGLVLNPIETVISAQNTPGNNALSATLISLAQEGYMTIKQVSKNEFQFNKTAKDIVDGDVRSYEKALYDSIFKDSMESVSTKELTNNTSFASAATSLPDKAGSELQKFGLFKKNPVSVANTFLGIGLTSVFFGNILLALVTLFMGRKSAERTESGIKAYSEAISLKNFLTSQNDQFDFQAQEMMFFEKLLPYATAFGVEDVWIKRFKDLYNVNPEWYQGNDLANYAVFNHVVGSTFRGATAGTSSSGFYSGFSGGSSGGGGGGGGGGSW